MSSLAEYKTIKATQVRIAAERFYVLLEDGRELGIPYDWYWRLAEAICFPKVLRFYIFSR